MCQECRLKANALLAALIAAGATHLHVVDAVDRTLPVYGDDDQLLLAELSALLTTGAKIGTAEDGRAAAALEKAGVHDRLRALPANILHDMMVFSQDIRDLLDTVHDITAVVMAERAISGDEGARSVMSPRQAQGVMLRMMAELRVMEAAEAAEEAQGKSQLN